MRQSQRTDTRQVRKHGQAPAFTRFLFYGGKGGVGKTTCAAARAIVEAGRGARVLVASTDPAHSLADAFAVRLSDKPRTLSGVPPAAGRRRSGSLDAVELSARKAFERWLAQHRGALGDAIEHGTWLDRGEVEALLDLPLPGIDELAGMLELARLGRVDLESAAPAPSQAGNSRRRSDNSSPAYDIIVVDTAPTGHTLRLLTSPEAVRTLAQALDDLQQEHRFVRERLAPVWRAEASDRLIARLASQARQMAEVLRDAPRTTFHWVTLPERLALAESEDAIAAIERRGIPVAQLIVNRALPRGPRCPVCDARREDERLVIAALAGRLGPGRAIRIVSAQVREPRGINALAAFGRETIAIRQVGAGAPPRTRRWTALSVAPVPVLISSRRQRIGGSSRQNPQGTRDIQPAIWPPSPDLPGPMQLLLVAGKGGVGKTTVAAALAARLARSNPARRLLLLSTDPAHSLGDVFDAAPGAIGDEPKRVAQGPDNLFVRELDALAALTAKRAALEHALDEIAALFGAGAAGQRGGDLFDLAPPGIDELFGMLSLVDACENYGLTVVDMAPTGHALRLLAEPEAARQWVQALMRMLLKYRTVARPDRLAQELVVLSKSIRDLQTLFHDRSRTTVLIVTRAAEVPRLETARLVAELRRLNMPASMIVVNAMTLGPGRCARCRRTAAVEQAALAALRRDVRVAARGSVIIQTALAAPPPRGIASLEQWAALWTSKLRGA